MKICTRCQAEHDSRFKKCAECRAAQNAYYKAWQDGDHRGLCRYCDSVLPPRKKSICDSVECARRARIEKQDRARALYARSDEKRAAVREHQRRWRARNLEQVRAIHRSHYQRNSEIYKERVRRRDALKRASCVSIFSLEDLEKRLSMYAGCWICGTPEWEHVDHVKPLSRGGPHILANLRPACASCNIRKGATWPLP